MNQVEFKETVWDYYRHHGRDLPWRQPQGGGFDPYRILVSELMLQQTGVARVIPKYEQFLDTFPTIQQLAAAPLSEVLTVWNGLGYNRRAKFLWQAAQQIGHDYHGIFPRQIRQLVHLPGVGKNTAGAIAAYAFNQPAVFVETNIRTVYIHHFFPGVDNVSDAQIAQLVTQTLDHEHPREWYWALMDYGASLKATVGNLSRASKHYSKQSSFAGSRRFVRGSVIRLLTEKPWTIKALRAQIPDERLDSVLDDLCREQLIIRRNQTYSL